MSGSRNLTITSILKLVGGTAGGQLIIIISIPILTRLYQPDEFGAFQLIDAVAQILMISGALAFDRSFVVTQKNNIHNVSLIFISCFLHLVLGAIVAFFTVIFLSEVFIEGMGGWIVSFIMIYIIYLSRGLYRVLSMYAMSLGLYGTIAKSELSRAFMLSSARVLLGFFGGGVLGLIVSAVIGSFFGIFSLIRISIRNILLDISDISIKKIINIAVIYKKFPLIEGPAALLGVCGERLPLLLIAIYYGADATGIYGIAFMLVNRPLDIIVQAANNVFRTAVGSRSHANDRASMRSTIIALSSLWGLTILAVSGAAVLGPWVFPMLLGAEWSAVGPLVPALCISIGAFMVLRPTLGVLSAMRLQTMVLYGQMLMLMASAGTLLIGAEVFKFEIYDNLIFMGVVSVASTVIYIMFSLYFVFKAK
ncbi:oligosaccharide flippase family protein [Pannonibacter phragmitetus]|uniref:oligosaccharide flippase family protein n=1 Tax=Pannonibacter phragmitetus TaxID=121719 RepID=UPI000B97A75B|nr:oligosaccharide flippase family protein [Pannonibacter phragmitetus]